MTLDDLQKHYLEDIKIDEATIEKKVINIPIMISKYQNYYYKTLEKITTLYDLKEKTYHDILIEYKSGQSDLSNYTFSSTELKRMLESSLVYREIELKLHKAENELKLVEEYMKSIKDISWGIKSYIDYKKLQQGII